MNRQKEILVISQTKELIDLARVALEGGAVVIQAASETEALDKIRARHPDMVIIGDIGGPDDVFRFYNHLKEGWISRHSSIIIVEKDTSQNSYRLLSDENLVTGIDGHIMRPSASSPLVSPSLLPSALKEKIFSKLKARINKLRESVLDPDDFCLTWEQIPGQGAFEARQAQVLENAHKAARGGKICSITVTDNPGGNPAIATEMLCHEIRKLGIEPIVHVAFRDRSRNQVESLLYQLAALDVNNLLILTGDYPSNIGFQGKSRPVFDLDAVNGIRLVREMNEGMEHEIMRRKAVLTPTDFYAGVAFSPFKQEEAEVMGQYYKLKKKIIAGADFIITQVGYDARKLNELQQWLKNNRFDIPVLTSIHVISLAAARVMNANLVPGCVVSDKLLNEISEEASRPDKGRQVRLDRAARLYAISRGMGFAGACIGGQGISYENVEYIASKGEELTQNWRDLVHEFDYPQEKGFYYFEKDIKGGLNSENITPRKEKPVRPLIFFLSRIFHVTIFEPKSPLFKLIKPLMRIIDSSTIMRKLFGSLEYWIKAVLYGCMNCGDCSLFDVAYLCPVSQCPKNQRNGPCGGSYQGWCEVYPGEKKCIWVRAYLRLKLWHQEDSIGAYIVPPCNWELWQTSSWLNYFAGRDHVSKRLSSGNKIDGKENKDSTQG